jgi:hypothetical protein
MSKAKFNGLHRPTYPSEQQLRDQIVRLLDKNTAAGVRPHEVFGDWIDLTAATLETIPLRWRAHWAGEPFNDTPETQALFTRLRGKYGYHGNNPRPYFDRFAECTSLLLEAASVDYMDLPGSVYMEMGVGNVNAGQFFTPIHLAMAMGCMIGGDDKEVSTNVKAAIAESPIAQALLIAGVIAPPHLGQDYLVARVLPHVHGNIKRVNVLDPACGSGVMFLAHAANAPQWMVKMGYYQYHGQDIDALCVQMARVNNMLYGLNGFYAPIVVYMAEARLQQEWRMDAAAVPPEVVERVVEVCPPPPTDVTAPMSQPEAEYLSKMLGPKQASYQQSSIFDMLGEPDVVYHTGKRNGRRIHVMDVPPQREGALHPCV